MTNLTKKTVICKYKDKKNRKKITHIRFFNIKEVTLRHILDV
jgi:hypothetical protein